MIRKLQDPINLVPEPPPVEEGSFLVCDTLDAFPFCTTDGMREIYMRSMYGGFTLLFNEVTRKIDVKPSIVECQCSYCGCTQYWDAALEAAHCIACGAPISKEDVLED